MNEKRNTYWRECLHDDGQCQEVTGESEYEEEFPICKGVRRIDPVVGATHHS